MRNMEIEVWVLFWFVGFFFVGKLSSSTEPSIYSFVGDQKPGIAQFYKDRVLQDWIDLAVIFCPNFSEIINRVAGGK